MRVLGWAFLVALCVVLCTRAARGHPVEEDDGNAAIYDDNGIGAGVTEDGSGEEDIGNGKEEPEGNEEEDGKEEGGVEEPEGNEEEDGKEEGGVEEPEGNEEEDGKEEGGVEEPEGNEEEEDGKEEGGVEEPEGNEEEEDGKEEGGEEEPEGSEEEEEVCEVIGEVQNLVLTQNGDFLTAVWDRPADSGNCPLNYRITFADGVRLLIGETIETFYEFTEPLIPCSEIDVTVSPQSSADGPSLPTSASITAASRTLIAPVLYNITTSCNTIQTVWEGEPFEENMCEVTHFQLLCHAENHAFSISTGVSDNTYRIFDVLISVLEPDKFYTCNGFVFVTQSGFSPPSESLEFLSNLEVISDFVISETETSVVAQWSPPVNSEECGVVYEVVIDNEDVGSRTEEIEDLSIDLNVPLIPCSTTTVTVTPIANSGGRGESKTIVHVNALRSINPVQDLQIEDDLVTWNQPVGLGRCVVSFLVTQSNNLGKQEVSTSENSLEIPLVPCSWNVIEVSAVFEDRIGPAEEATITAAAPDVGGVRDVTFSEIDNSLSVSWEKPYGDLGVCEVDYVINQAVTGEVLTFQTSETSQDLSFIGCTESEVTIFAKVEGVAGVSSTKVYETGISSIGPVTDLQITSSGIQWAQPAGVGNCALSYRLTVEDNFNQREISSDDTSIDLDFIPCSELTVTVFALSGVVVGTSKSINGVASAAAPSAPVHVLTIPSFTGANITLQANSLSDNFCALSQASVRCVDLDQIATALQLNIADDASRQFTLNVNELQPDNIYTCTVAWLIGTALLESPLSEPIVFRTVLVETKTLEISEVTSDGFVVRWNEPYGLEFVDSYNILIDNLGPNFFIPEDCPQPEGGDFNVLLQVKEYDFNEGLPDTSYEVKLITTYTLGSTITSEVEAVSTLPGIPEAPIGLQALWRYGLGQTYNVSADLTWELPCNINGPLSHFGVAVTTLAQIGNRNVEYEDLFEVAANDEITDRSYGFLLADMNPFFTYLVSVKAVGGLAGPAETLFVQPPSACTCTYATLPFVIDIV